MSQSNRNQVIVPTTNPYSIVFPFDARKKEFQTNDYSSIQTENRASDIEISNIVNEINQIHKPYARKTDGAACMCCFLFIAGVIGIIYVNNTQDISPWAITEISISIGIGIFLLTIAIGLYCQRIEKKSRTLVQKRLDIINAEFSGRGLRWYVPVHYPKWIELHKDYFTEAAGYMPPQMTQQFPSYSALPINYQLEFQQSYQPIHQPNYQQEIQLVDQKGYNQSAY